jgi:hypothetical protein
MEKNMYTIKTPGGKNYIHNQNSRGFSTVLTLKGLRDNPNSPNCQKVL